MKPTYIQFELSVFNFKRLFAALVLILVTPEAYSAITCIEGLKGRELHTVEVLDGEHTLVYDAPIAMEDDPNKPVVVYLGGFGLGFENSASYAAKSRKSPFDLVRVSLIGNGRSLLHEIQSDSDYSSPTTICGEKQAEAVADLIEQKFSRRTVLVQGLSYGGMISALVARDYPEMVDGVIPSASYAEDMVVVNTPTAFGPFGVFFAASQELGRQQLLRMNFAGSIPSVLEQYDHEYQMNLYALEHGIRDLELVDVLAQVTEVPVFMLAATHDPAVDIDLLKAAFAAVPEGMQGEFKAIMSSHHNIILHNPIRSIRFTNRIVNTHYLP